ncbi:hypothetical protein C8F04DRAFT_875622, partial [Mycena alexandri]
AQAWLHRAAAAADLIDPVNECLAMFEYLPWDTIVPGLSSAVQLTTEDLASFLSNAWLNDEMINAGVDYILQRVGPGSRIRILNCLFIQSLRNAHGKQTNYHPPSFSPIERAIHANFVWFPLHISGNHWTLLKIDLLTKTIAYADSLGGTFLKEELALVRWWLKGLGDCAKFEVIKPDFPCPRQHDSSSCDIIVLSILASVLLNFDMWTSETAQAQRTKWFLRL